MSLGLVTKTYETQDSLSRTSRTMLLGSLPKETPVMIVLLRGYNLPQRGAEQGYDSTQVLLILVILRFWEVLMRVPEAVESDCDRVPIGRT